jgi:hypothetical protein
VHQLKEETGQSRLERAVASLLSHLQGRTGESARDMFSTVVAA